MHGRMSVLEKEVLNACTCLGKEKPELSVCDLPVYLFVKFNFVNHVTA